MCEREKFFYLYLHGLFCYFMYCSFCETSVSVFGMMICHDIQYFPR